MGKLNKKDFYRVIEKTPLVSVDFIIKSKDDKILLGYRNNNPARGTYFTPGGVIHKNELVGEAITRVLKNELGLDYESIKNYINFNRVYNHIYPNNFKNDLFSTHYVCLSYIINLPKQNDKYNITSKDKQHGSIAWYSHDEIIKSNKVHNYVKEMILDIKW
jgi:colanic acid biosynthesis protein WcaH